MDKKICIIINNTSGLYAFRAALIKKLIEEKFSIVVIAECDGFDEELRKIGCRIVLTNPGRHATNPFKDLKLMLNYKKILKQEKPDIVLTYNIKPNVYGGLACKILKIPFIANVTGLGTPLEVKSKIQQLAIFLYRIGVRNAECVFFQNEANKQFFVTHGMLQSNAYTRVIPGSGVDLVAHPLLPWPKENRIHFLFASRIRSDKGIDLFLSAARYFASSSVVFDICGACEDEKYIEILKEEKSVNYYGEQKDLTPFYQKCSCFLYPSYYPEGMSNVLLEAAASGRPVIAANRPGCKETLEDGVTGFLVPIKNEKAVLEATRKFLNMSVEERRDMGLKGHEKMVREFDREYVVAAYLEEIKKTVMQ